MLLRTVHFLKNGEGADSSDEEYFYSGDALVSRGQTLSAQLLID